MINYKQYYVEDSVFYKYKKPCYLYHVDIFKYTSNSDDQFTMELVDSGEFETEQFIGFSDTKYSKSDKPGIRYTKETYLLAAPDNFIKKHNIKQLEENEGQGSKQRPSKGKRSTNGHQKARVQKRTSNKG